MTIFFALDEALAGEASREKAVKVFQKITLLLQIHEMIEISLKNANLTPSVADEVFGKLAQTLGKDNFTKRIKITDPSQAHQALVAHVVARRTRI